MDKSSGALRELLDALTLPRSTMVHWRSERPNAVHAVDAICRAVAKLKQAHLCFSIERGGTVSMAIVADMLGSREAESNLG